MPVPGENVGGTVVKLLFKKGVLDSPDALEKEKPLSRVWAFTLGVEGLLQEGKGHRVQVQSAKCFWSRTTNVSSHSKLNWLDILAKT